MPKVIEIKHKEYVPKDLVNASFLDNTAKDVLGWLIKDGSEDLEEYSRKELSDLFKVSIYTLNRNLIALQDIGAIELGGPRYGDTLTIKLIKENI